MGRLWRRIRKALTPRVSQRITRAGLWFTITILLTGVGAFLSANNLIFLILSALLATLVVSGNLNRLTLAGLEVEFQPPEHLFAGVGETGRVVVRNTKSWFPSFALRLASAKDNGLRRSVFLPLLGPGETVSFSAEVRFARRGRYQENGFEFSSRFPFGFAERRAGVTLVGEVIVYPGLRPECLEGTAFQAVAAEAEARRRGAGTEFERIRGYEPGDEARRMDWRSSARRGELHVREYGVEEAGEVVVVLDLRGWSAEGFEEVVSVVATEVEDLCRRGFGVRLVTQERTLVAPGETDVYGLLRYLATVEAEPLGGAVEAEGAIVLVHAAAGTRVCYAQRS